MQTGNRMLLDSLNEVRQFYDRIIVYICNHIEDCFCSFFLIIILLNFTSLGIDKNIVFVILKLVEYFLEISCRALKLWDFIQLLEAQQLKLWVFQENADSLVRFKDLTMLT